jgi:flavin reductase (DIM6/NTAB) family NADH-FMN oxidoreductase RutF
MSMNTASVPDPDDATPMDLMVFREVLATFPAGVVIVTATGADGTPAGLTVSAFCSVSADPTRGLVCVDQGSNTLSAIRESGAFSVNILAAGREELALAFASKREDKFEGVEWEAPQLAGGGAVLRADAAAYLVCRVHQEVEAGDHWVFIGEAVEAGIQEGHPPLLYHQRGFASLAT